MDVAVEVAAAATGDADTDCDEGSALELTPEELGATTAVTLMWHSTM